MLFAPIRHLTKIPAPIEPGREFLINEAIQIKLRPAQENR